MKTVRALAQEMWSRKEKLEREGCIGAVIFPGSAKENIQWSVVLCYGTMARPTARRSRCADLWIRRGGMLRPYVIRHGETVDAALRRARL